MSSRKKVILEERSGVLGKQCTLCNEWVPLDYFSNSKKGLGGKESRCKKCQAEQARNWYKATKDDNLEKNRENTKNWRKNNPEKRALQMKRYRVKNRDKILAYYVSRRGRKRETMKIWRDRFPEKHKTIRLNRRAMKNYLPSEISPEELLAVSTKFNNGCCLTGDRENVHFDHVIPLSIGHGGTSYGNMIPLRGDLNISKSNNNIFEWFESNRQRFNLSQEKFDALIAWLAEVNEVSVEDYRDYVYWCHENPHSLEDLRNDDEGEAI